MKALIITGKLDIKGFAIEQLYADVILVEYVDETNGAIDANGLMKIDLKSKVWRKAIVRAVSPWVASQGRTKPGDFVLFPNDKGLTTGKINYRDIDGTIKEATSAVFLTENKLISNLSKID